MGNRRRFTSTRNAARTTVSWLCATKGRAICEPCSFHQPTVNLECWSRLLLPVDNTHAFPHAIDVTSLPVTQARNKLYQLLDEAADSHEPIQITGKRANAVLISEDDWRSIQETLYLVSIPGMRESIRKGMAEPLDKASKNPGW